MRVTHPTKIERVEGLLMAVNSYVVEGPDGIVIIDGQLTVSDARAVRQLVDQIDRPVAGLLVTHPHPDHYAAAGMLLEGLDAPIYATHDVARIIARDDAEKDSIVGPMMGDEWPTGRRFPDEIVVAGESLSLGGLTFDVSALGPGESHADVMFTVDDTIAFTGDIAYNDAHAYLLDVHHRQWVEVLTLLERELGDATLHVGHGAPTTTAVLRRQIDYIDTFVGAVWSCRDADERERHDHVLAAMTPMVSDQRLAFLMELSIEPMLRALRSEVDG